MCGCGGNANAVDKAAVPEGAVRLSVPDMTCGHCASTVTGAIKGAFPAAQVQADPESRLVLVSGAGDAAALAKVVRDAGYTPAAA